MTLESRGPADEVRPCQRRVRACRGRNSANVARTCACRRSFDVCPLRSPRIERTSGCNERTSRVSRPRSRACLARTRASRRRKPSREARKRRIERRRSVFELRFSRSRGRRNAWAARSSRFERTRRVTVPRTSPCRRSIGGGRPRTLASVARSLASGARNPPSYAHSGRNRPCLVDWIPGNAISRTLSFEGHDDEARGFVR